MFRKLHQSIQENFVDILETQQNFTRQNEDYYQGLREYGAPPTIAQNIIGQGALNNLTRATQTYDPYTQINQPTVNDASISAVILTNVRPEIQASRSEEEGARCRRYNGLSGIEQMIRENAANPNRPLRCGFRYKASSGIAPTVAQGAYGSSNGPLLANEQDRIGNGVQWIWDLNEARKTLLRDSAKNMGANCGSLSVLPFVQNGAFQGNLAYCTSSKKFIPIINGRPRYTRDIALNCPQRDVVTNALRCPSTPPPGSVPGRPTSPGDQTIRDCTASGVSLTRDCLLQAVTIAGCSDTGTLYTSLQKEPPSAPRYDGDLNLRRSFRDYQLAQGTTGLSQNLFRQGQATITNALADIGRLQTAANTARDNRIRNAAFDLCYRAGEYDKYDFCADIVDTALLSTVDLECIQKYWQNKGGKPAGKAYPRNNTHAMEALGNPRTWGTYKAGVDTLQTRLTSTDINEQKKAYEDFLGIDLGIVPFTEFAFPRWQSNQISQIGSIEMDGNQVSFLQNRNNQTAGIYFNQKVMVGEFTTQFEFSIQGNALADAFSFVIQNQSPTAIGGAGGNNAFLGIQNGLAVMFDYFPNSSIGIYTSAEWNRRNRGAPHEFQSPVINFRNRSRYSVNLQYSEKILRGVLLDINSGEQFFFQKNIDIPVVVQGNEAWVGFVASSGGFSSTPLLFSWNWVSKASALIERPPFNPLQIPGLATWFDGKDRNSITFSGSRVVTWQDKSRNTRNATAVGNITYSSDSLVFDGSSHFNLDLNFLAGASHSAFVVLEATNYVNIYGAADPGRGGNSFHAGFTNANNYRLNFWGNDYQPSFRSFNRGRTNMVNWEWINNTSKSIYANGNLEGTINQRGQIGTMSGGGRIGNVVRQGIFQGRIKEIIILLNNDITTENRNKIEGYLAWKWGFVDTLPNNHPFKNSAPTS
jgi:hypothetical protein